MQIMKDKLSSEQLWGLIIVISGVLPRLLFAHYFPSQPVSDFKAIIDFANEFSKNIFSNYYAWRSISPGLPLILSFLFRIFSTSTPASIARWCTVLFTGLTPLLPYLIWRDIFSHRVRITASLLLALWPGQIVFSTVVAQDNWILIPTVALCSLALRIFKGNEIGKPICGATLYVLAVSIRQEMLIVLLPVAILIIIGKQSKSQRTNLFRGGLIIGALLSLLIWHRGQSTGIYTLSSSHIGRSMLGSYVPGAGLGWVDPSAYLAATNPELLYKLDKDFESAQAEMADLAIRELFRRPQFQATRIIGATIYALTSGDGDNLFWSLSAPGVLSDSQQKQVQSFTAGILPYLKIYALAIHSLFIAALVFSGRNKNRFILALPVTAIIVLKIAVHAVIVITPRYFLAIIAMELLFVAIMVSEFFVQPNQKFALQATLSGLLLVAFISLYQFPQIRKYIQSNDETSIQHSYRFPLKPISTKQTVLIDCFMDKGWLGLNGSQEATIFFLHYHPHLNEVASATCKIDAVEPASLILSVYDPYERGSAPDIIDQIIYINGVEVARHNISGIAWSGWTDVPLQVKESATVTVELFVKNPKPDEGWDRDIIPTKFKFSFNE